jgi:formylglycine-generating enzyme required for sulfatase activity
MALIPEGSFSMGDALDGTSDAPVHTVSVSAFYMETNLVTKSQWDAVRAWGLTNGYTDLPGVRERQRIIRFRASAGMRW